MRPLRPGPRRRDPARLQPSSCRSPRAPGRRPLRASDPDRHLPRPDPGGDRPFSTSTALRAPSVCSRRHPRHPRQSPIHQPRPSAPPEPDHQIPIARRLEDRGFVLRGLSYACQRPKLFTKADRLLFGLLPRKADAEAVRQLLTHLRHRPARIPQRSRPGVLFLSVGSPGGAKQIPWAGGWRSAQWQSGVVHPPLWRRPCLIELTLSKSRPPSAPILEQFSRRWN